MDLSERVERWAHFVGFQFALAWNWFIYRVLFSYLGAISGDRMYSLVVNLNRFDKAGL